MSTTYYIFAFYIFLLVCVCMWVYGKVSHSGKKDEKNNYEKEKRLFKLYQNVEDMMNSFEEYVEETKKEMNQKTTLISTMLEKVNRMSTEVDADVQNIIKTEQLQHTSEVQVLNVENKQKMKTEELISLLMEQGMAQKEIAKELGISSREVSLIMQIKKIRDPANKI